MTRRARWSRRWTWCWVLVLCSLLLGACADQSPDEAGAPSDDGPRPVTTAEAERLAVVRFNNYDRERSPVSMVLPAGEGQQLTLEGRVDFRRHRGVGVLSAPDGAAGLIAWNLQRVAVRQSPDRLPARLPSEGWEVRPLSPDLGFDQSLALALQLASDRPENPQLLRQNGAVWVGSTSLDDVDVDLMQVPALGEETAANTYYVDASGLLQRVDVTLTDGQVATLRFESGDADPVPPTPRG